MFVLLVYLFVIKKIDTNRLSRLFNFNIIYLKEQQPFILLRFLMERNSKNVFIDKQVIDLLIKCVISTHMSFSNGQIENLYVPITSV